MKMEIREQVLQTRTIDVEFPYYYKQEIQVNEDRTVMIYGKKMERKELVIKETIDHESDYEAYELENEFRNDSYYKDEFKSNEHEFNEAKERFNKFFVYF